MLHALLGKCLPRASGLHVDYYLFLGEMHFIRSGPDSYFHLPRHGGVAYAAQESWVQNETIKVTLSHAGFSNLII